MQKPKVKDLAQGSWKAILPALGVASTFLTGKHGPCPMCEGRDRFRFDDKEGHGTWFCSHCGAGDGIKLVMTKLVLDFREAAQRIENTLGAAPLPTATPKADPDKAKRDKDRMNEVWQSGRRLDLQSVAGRYLHARTGATEFSHDLRSVAALAHFVKGERVPTKHPALIALVRDYEGRAVNVHRTYLDASGVKAAIDPNRKLMEGGSTAGGAAIRLAAPTNELGIAEGIETALSASALHGVPCWAAVSALGMEQWRPPEKGLRIFIFGESDLNFVGQKAAFTLAWRLAKEGFDTRVLIPEADGADWNDLHQRVLRETMLAAE